MNQSPDEKRQDPPNFQLRRLEPDESTAPPLPPGLMQIVVLPSHVLERRTLMGFGLSAAAALALAGGSSCTPTAPSAAPAQQSPPTSVATASTRPTAPAAGANPTAISNQCPPGETPRFQLGFASLKEQLGAVMGDPITCEYPDPSGTGDIEQQTTTGLAYWRHATNTPSFTNGYERWALTDRALVHWVGPIDVPTLTPVPTSTSTPNPTSTPVPSRGGTTSSSGTQPCGAPIPPGAICTCNCIPAR